MRERVAQVNAVKFVDDAIAVLVNIPDVARQGVGKRTQRLRGMEGYPVLMDGTNNSMGTPRQEYMDNRWTPDNPNSRL